MSLTKFIRDVQKIYEAIPTPGAIVYNATAAKILRKPERKIVNDIVKRIGGQFSMLIYSNLRLCSECKERNARGE